MLIPVRLDLLSRLALPFTRAELPGWGKMFDLFRIGSVHDHLWKDSPTKVIRAKHHGYWMELDLRNWSERHAYFLGRFYDSATLAVLSHALRPGDRVLDIGANIGMITLHAAAMVGPGGRVEAFEPNPTCCRKIEANLARNSISQVQIHRVALSDEPGTLTLRTPASHTGTGTLAALSEEQRLEFTVEFPVEVGVGDDIIERDPRPVDFIKIDVEGFECRTLRGLTRTLERWKPPVLTEMIGAWLERAGSSVDQLVELMTGHGYEGFSISEPRQGLRRVLHLEPLGQPRPDFSGDVLWVHPEGRNHNRITILPTLSAP